MAVSEDNRTGTEQLAPAKEQTSCAAQPAPFCPPSPPLSCPSADISCLSPEICPPESKPTCSIPLPSPPASPSSLRPMPTTTTATTTSPSSSSNTRSAAAFLRSRITVILTTSPIQSHPSTVILEHVLNSFSRAPGLPQCDKIVIFDGWRLYSDNQPKSGRCSDEMGRNYGVYVGRAKDLLLNSLPEVEEDVGELDGLGEGVHEARVGQGYEIGRSKLGSMGEEAVGESTGEAKNGVSSSGKCNGEPPPSPSRSPSPLPSIPSPSSSSIPTSQTNRNGYIVETHTQTVRTGAQTTCTAHVTSAHTPSRKRTPLRTLEMSDRIGFALAVRTALEYVKTRYVLVVQHDWEFIRELDLETIVRAMERDSDEVKYVGFISSRVEEYAERKGKGPMLPPSLVEPGRFAIPLARLYFWFDKNHVAEADHYRNFVFSCGRFQRGDFIEDTFGQAQLTDIKRPTAAEGIAVHAKYATWLYYPQNGRVSHLFHLNGRKYLTAELRKKYIERQK
ncbi:hypothetical protein HK104_005909, partial [Borealophlyctis nickersoniae]